MYSLVWTPFTRALMITAFVAVMMITVEYISVLTRGTFQDALSRNRWAQYLAAALLGALPGCLGPFTIVARYTHRALPLPRGSRRRRLSLLSRNERAAAVASPPGGENRSNDINARIFRYRIHRARRTVGVELDPRDAIGGQRVRYVRR